MLTDSFKNRKYSYVLTANIYHQTDMRPPPRSRPLPPPDHPWRLAGVEAFGTEALLKVFQYNDTPTTEQLLRAGGGDANYNQAIALLLEQGAIEVCSKRPTKYRLKAK